MLTRRTSSFPVPACADRYPLLAVQDGQLGEMVRRARGDHTDTLALLLGDLYPNASWNG